MADQIETKPLPYEAQEKKKRKPIFTVLTAILIVVLALLLLCVFPGGDSVLGIVLPKPKVPSVITNLPPIKFQEISPPAGGGSSTVVFPLPPVIVVDTPPLPITPTPPLTPTGGNPPSTDLAVNGSNETIQIPNNTSASLTWETNNDPDECVASGDWSGSKNPNGGAEITGPLSGPDNYTYKITC